jgi:hypothetical protein
MPLDWVTSLKCVLEDGEGLPVECDVDDVGVAVVVEVAEIEAHPGDEGAFLRQRCVGLEGHLFKLVAEIMEEEVVLGVVGNEKVLPAVEVEVGNTDSHAFADMVAESPFLGDVFEGAVPLV